MSSRLVTTPWFTKNFAGGWLATGSSSGGTRVGRDGAMVARHARQRMTESAPQIRAAYDPAVLLAIDVGNSNITIGSFRNGSLTAVRRSTTPRDATADQLEILLEELLRLDDTAFADVSAIACASVVPTVTAALERVADRRDRP